MKFNLYNISLRTLAIWRSEGLIDYVQLGSKLGTQKKTGLISFRRIWFVEQEVLLEANSILY